MRGRAGWALGWAAGAAAVAIAAGGAALASVWNVVEDGLDRQWAFFVTASGTGLLLVGLAGLAAAISFGRC